MSLKQDLKMSDQSSIPVAVIQASLATKSDCHFRINILTENKRVIPPLFSVTRQELNEEVADIPTNLNLNTEVEEIILD